jgi:hypothetical protein
MSLPYNSTCPQSSERLNPRLFSDRTIVNTPPQRNRQIARGKLQCMMQRKQAKSKYKSTKLKCDVGKAEIMADVKHTNLPSF